MLILIAALFVAGLAALLERREGRIPLWVAGSALVVAPLAHAGLALARHATLDDALVEAGLSLAGAIATGIVPFVLYRRQALGGSDALLFTALGAIAQPTMGLEIFVYGLLAIALFAAVHLARSGKLRRTFANTVALVRGALRPKEERVELEPGTTTWFRIGSGVFVGTAITLVLHVASGGQ